MCPYNNVAILKMKTKKSANFEAPNLVYTRLLLASLGEGNGNPLQYSFLENPSGWDGKESACNAGDLGLIPGMGRFPWRREWLPTSLFLPGEFHGQRSLMSYSPWGQKESDMTELLTNWVQCNETLLTCTDADRRGFLFAEALIPAVQQCQRWHNSN